MPSSTFTTSGVAQGVETTVWYEESGALVHITRYLETQTTHRFAALPTWLAEDTTVYRVTTKTPRSSRKSESLFRSARIDPGTSSTMRATQGDLIVPCPEDWQVDFQFLWLHLHRCRP